MSQKATFIALLLGAVGLCSPAFAQETTATIKGRVLDPQHRPVVAPVVVTGIQGAVTVTSDENGRFTAPFLPPGTYSVRTAISGFQPEERQGLVLSLGQILEVTFALKLASVTSQVEVSVAPPLIDTQSTTLGAAVDGDFAATVPLGRRISDTAYMSSGVSKAGSVGLANPSISGGSGLDNQYVIDGVNVTNVGFGAFGSFSSVFGSLGNAIPFDFMKQVLVKTGGYGAEFGQTTAGIVNVVTKSGTNAIHGTAFGYASSAGMQGDWMKYQSANGTVQTISTSSTDAGGELGLPAVRDRLFLFAAVDPQQDVRTLQAPSGFPLLALGDVERTRRSVPYAVKSTARLSGRQRLELSLFGDPSHGPMGAQRAVALKGTDKASFSQLDYGGHNQAVRYQAVFGNGWLVEATMAHALNTFAELPSTNEWRVRDRTVTPNVFSGGIGTYEGGNRGTSVQTSASATRVYRAHEVRLGLEYDAGQYALLNQRTGPTFVTPAGDQTATGATVSVFKDPTFGKIYRATANLNTERKSTQRYGTFFVQDGWKATSRLTLSLGLRYDQERLAGTIVDCSTEANCLKLKNNWAPRVGAAYDPLGNGTMKVFGSYGRYFARMPNDLAAKVLSADATMIADYYDAALAKPIPNGVVAGPATGPTTIHYSLVGATADRIDPNAKMSYADEYSGGVERELPGHSSVGVHFIHRNLGRVLEDIGPAPLVAYSAGVLGLGSVPNYLTNPSASSPVLPAAQYLGASFSDPVQKYDAVDVTFTHRLMDRWAALASYRWSRLRGNYEGFFRDANGQADPGNTSLYDFPANDPSYAAAGATKYGYQGDIRFLNDPNGILPLDRPHQVKLFGWYSWRAFGLGLSLNMQSGKPLTPLTSFPLPGGPGGEIPLAALGSGIQTVDGFKTRTPFESQADLRASYRARTGRHEVTLLLDVFNLFNQRRTLDYDTWSTLSFGVPNPDFGTPTSQNALEAQNASAPQFQAPMSVRVGVRFGF